MAIYVRFNHGRIAKTKEISCDENGVITVDLDKNHNVIGIEAIGIGQVTLARLMQKARVDAPKVDLSRTRFGAFQEAAVASSGI
ncbi:MAG: DUF2283 domain-containing protein [Bdellovibrionaceae bacterium]|nr:DUF2283 domain-containing protein [Pseudobdellovibrionaceae bacterium]